MSRDCRYICQRAANAIISEVGTYRVSNDALLGINQFLDEFLTQLLNHCQSLDLSHIKASVFALLPSSLGKNAIVEAELEVKTFTETEVIDYDAYERMRTLGQHSAFPTQSCLGLLRDKCFEYCTLADKDDQLAWVTQPERQDIVISPIVAIYITTVLEHMAEYVLTAVAMTCETEDTDYVRIKELFLALADDSQVGYAFQKMELRDKMEARVFPSSQNRRASMVATPLHTPKLAPKKDFFSPTSSQALGSSPIATGYLDISFDDLSIGESAQDEEEDPRQLRRPNTAMSSHSVHTTATRRSNSIMTSNTSNFTSVSLASHGSGNGNKKAYKVFQQAAPTPASSQASAPVYDPDAPTMNFEDLVRSGNTMRVSLTPNRLRSIEVKNQMADEPAKPAWKRRSSSVPRMSSSSSRPSSRQSSRPQTPTSLHPSGNSFHPPRNSQQATIPAPPLTSLPSGGSMPRLSANGSSSSLAPASAAPSATASPTASPKVKDDSRLRPSSPRASSPRASSPRASSPRPVSPRPVSPRPASPRTSTASPPATQAATRVSAPSSPKPSNRASSSPKPGNRAPPSSPKPSNRTSSVATTTTITTATAKVTTIKNKSSFDKRFEQPRNAPKPPPGSKTAGKVKSGSLGSRSSTSVNSIKSMDRNSSISSSSTSSLTSSPVKTRPAIPAEMKKSATTQAIASSKLSTASSSTASSTTAAASTAKQAASTTPLLRRSSGSSRKSRENLRKLKEKEETKERQQSQSSPKLTPSQKAASTTDLSTTPTSASSILSSSSSVTDSLASKDDKDAQSASAAPANTANTTKQRPERPSSIVAKRASMAGTSRRHSLHESYAINVMELETNQDDEGAEAKSSPAVHHRSTSPPPLPHSSSGLEDPQSSAADHDTADTTAAAKKELSEAPKKENDGTASTPPASASTSSSSSSSSLPSSPPTIVTTSPLPSANDNKLQTQSLDSPAPSEEPSSEDARSDSPTDLPEEDRKLLTPALQRRTSVANNRRSMVLDKVLQFERAQSLDDVQQQQQQQQRRASSYIPRRERFMYLQQNPTSNIMDRKHQYPHLHHRGITTPSSKNWVRPGTSDAIAAAAARFSAGVSLGVQTDQPPATPPTLQKKSKKRLAAASKPTGANKDMPALVVTDASGQTLDSAKAVDSDDDDGSLLTDSDDVVSEHGIVDGDEEWFLPEEEWEDFAEQETTVAEWLLGEA